MRVNLMEARDYAPMEDSPEMVGARAGSGIDLSGRLVTWSLGASCILAIIIALGMWFTNPSLEQRWRAIQSAIDSRLWADAEARLRRWVEENPEDGDAWAMLGGLLYEQGREPEALPALRRVRSGNQAWAHAQTLIGEIAIRRRDAAEAERILRGASEGDRRAVEPLRRLVYLLTLERRPAEARSALSGLFQLDRDPRHLADSLLLLWSETEARDVGPEIEEFLRKAPRDPWLSRAWGLSLLSRGRPAEALPHLEAAALAFENDPSGRFALAECRMMLGRFDGDLTILGTPPRRAVDLARWWVLRSRLEEAGGGPTRRWRA